MLNKKQRTGFALPAVLAVTGVVTLVFLVAITALASLTAEAGSARARVRFLQRAMTAEAMLSYLATTEPLSRTGFATGSPRSRDEFQGAEAIVTGSGATSAVSNVHLDGRPYRLEAPENLVLRLQDQAGMINLAGLSDVQWRRFAQRVGIAAGLANQTGARYRDYVDLDSLVAAGGAEQAAYGTARVPNRPLRRGSEWLSLFGVRESVDSAKWRAIRNDVAADQTLTFINVNTAPASALEILLGISPSQAQTAITTRENSPFNTMADLAAATGASVDGDPEVLYASPGGRVVYSIRDTQSAWTYRARLTLTPTGLEQPVWIDQTELTEAPRRAVADISDATRFPYAPR